MIGYTPRQVNEMSVWQYMAAVDGYAAAHDPDDAKGLSKDEIDDLWEFINR